jgi:hypothetical protein
MIIRINAIKITGIHNEKKVFIIKKLSLGLICSIDWLVLLKKLEE